jgi:hypothetical protein
MVFDFMDLLTNAWYQSVFNFTLVAIGSSWDKLVKRFLDI